MRKTLRDHFAVLEREWVECGILRDAKKISIDDCFRLRRGLQRQMEDLDALRIEMIEAGFGLHSDNDGMELGV